MSHLQRPGGGNRGFTLIELMIVVAIIGLLAAIAIPSYLDMRVRARVAEGITFMSPYKNQVADLIIGIGALPVRAQDPADVDYFETGGSGVVRRVRWSKGRAAIEIWFGSGGGTELSGRILWLQPTLGANGVISWRCMNHPEAVYRIQPHYLPASCRT